MTPVQRLTHLIKVLEKTRKQKKKFDLKSFWGKIKLPEYYQKKVDIWEKEYDKESGFSFETAERKRYVLNRLKPLINGLSVFHRTPTKRMELECGCAIGYAGYDMKFREQGLKLRMEVCYDHEEGYYISLIPGYKKFRQEHAVSEFFRIHYSYSKHLFNPQVNRTLIQEIGAVKKMIIKLKKEDKELKSVRGY